MPIDGDDMPPTKIPHPKEPVPPSSGVPRSGELSPSEKPGGTQEMPTSGRARRLRQDTNDQRDSNDLDSGTST
jgi:hypothetical protein